MTHIHRTNTGAWLRRLACVVAVCFGLMPGGRPGMAHAGATWYVTTATDDVADGDVSTNSGSLRFALAHAASGDFVSLARFDTVVSVIWIGETLVVPDGVAVGHLRNQPCGSPSTPLANIEAFSDSINPVFSLGAGSTLRGIDIGGGYISVRVTGADADLCGVGLGVMDDGGVPIPLPPMSSALVVDGARAWVHQSRINGFMVVSQRGSDTRIGDATGGNGEGNEGVRDTSVTILADATSAAQRVTVRDPFPRALFGLVGDGVSGGDDVPTHANNWAQTPTIAGAVTNDNFKTVSVRGTANPLSIVDIYFDDQVTVVRQAATKANASGVFTFSGSLPGPTVQVSAASTLDDLTYPGRVGSSSRLSPAVPVTAIAGPATIQLAPPLLTFAAVVSGTAPAGQALLLTVPPASPGLQWKTTATTELGGNWLAATPSGAGTGSVLVTVDQAGLASGTYTGTVTASDIADPSDSASSTVTLVVGSAVPAPRNVFLPFIVR